MRRILKASAVMAGSSAVTILVGLVRSKVIAILLGPDGMGLYGLLQAVQSTAGTIAGLGLSNSGVRQVAEARTQDAEAVLGVRLALFAATTLASTVVAGIVFLARVPIAALVFGTSADATSIGWLAPGVLATGLIGAFTAWLNGMGELRHLARASVLGAAIALPTTIPIIWLWGRSAISPSLSVGAWATLLGAWYFARRLETGSCRPTRDRFIAAFEPLVKNGVTFMVTSLLTVGVQSGVRILVTRHLGLAATGHFQAAWTVSMLYVGFVLNAMSADYYPRLTMVRDDSAKLKELVDEQTHAALLLASPFILAGLTLTPLLVTTLYAESFDATVSILRWQMLGDLFKVASFPLAFILLARGSRLAYLTTELSWNAIYLGSVWLLLPRLGAQATGIAFLIAYGLYFLIVALLVRTTSLYTISNSLTVHIAALTALSSIIPVLGTGRAAMVLGLVITSAATFHSVTKLGAGFRKTGN